jgi:hypothetical protein
MANVKLNPVVERMRGRIGDLVFKRVRGKSYVARTPERSGRGFNAAQQAHQERFRLAVQYGKAALAVPQTRVLYETIAKHRQQPVFSLTIQDYFIPPSVDDIDLSTYDRTAGSTIGIRASDVVEVVGVNVTISDPTGATLEQGAASVSTTEPGRWVYTATTSIPSGIQVRVEATATDRPGNKTTKTENA